MRTKPTVSEYLLVSQGRASKALEKRVADYEETANLCASEIACAVADAWTAIVKLLGEVHPGELRAVAPDLTSTLDRLEAATRGSALRKVQP